MTIEQAKNNLICTLDSIDKEKLSLPDLKLYAEILKTASEIQVKNFHEEMTEMFKFGFGGSHQPATLSELK